MSFYSPITISGSGSDQCGYSVAISSDNSTIAISSPSGNGFVTIYTWNGTTQTFLQTLYGKAGDNFGASIALNSDGSVLVVGAPGTSTMYIYRERSFSYSKDYTLTVESPNGFGRYVAISQSGNVVAAADTTQINVRTFFYDASIPLWSSGPVLDTTGALSAFTSIVGLAISGDGSSLAVVDSSNLCTGSISLANFTQVYNTTVVNISSLALDNTGNNIYIGNIFENLGNGAVYVYTKGDTNLNLVQTLSGTEGESIGTSLALSPDGNTLFVSNASQIAHGLTFGFTYHVNMYTYNEGTWSTATNIADAGTLDNGFGYALTTSNNAQTLVVGDPTGSGYTNIYYQGSPPPPVPCFMGNAQVLTPTGYKRFDTLQVGDKVQTADGRSVSIQAIRITPTNPSTSNNPYVVACGQFGANEEFLISPRHRIFISGKGVEARDLGLVQKTMSKPWSYYNIELPNWATDNLVVQGVEVESLAPVRRVMMSVQEFTKLIAKQYGQKALDRDFIRKILAQTEINGDTVLANILHK